MSQKYSVQTLHLHDILYIAGTEDFPESIFRITDIFEDGVGGYAKFGPEEPEEYGELYEDDFELIRSVYRPAK